MQLKFNAGEIVRRLGLALVLIILSGILALLSPSFLTTQNLLNVLLQASVNALLAAGMTLVIITAGIDLSVGSLLALTAVVTADLLSSGLAIPFAMALGFGVGAAAGLVNGLLITKTKIPPFIATLGMMTLARGLALSYTGGRPVTGMPGVFRLLGAGQVAGIPVPVVVIAAVYGVGFFILKRTTFGRYIFAVGNNSVAAEHAGVPVHRTTIAVYVISGLMAALAGMIMVARIDSAQPSMGLVFELNAIAAVVVGGTALAGGKGSLVGTLLGAILLALISNAINILNIPSFYAQVFQGAIIILALLAHNLVGGGET